MPEGDTLKKLASFMQPRMQGQSIVNTSIAGRAFDLWRHHKLIDVRVHGKHLLLQTEPWTLRVHLGLHGSWHSYRVGERWQRPRAQASVVLELGDGRVYVCFLAEDVELLSSRALIAGKRPLKRVGPDLLEEPAPIGEAVVRARRLPGSSKLIDVLLHQRTAAGFGNVYKSELLFLHALPVTSTLDDIDDTVLEVLYARGARLLRQNLGGFARTTTCDRRALSPHKRLMRPRLWVYAREQQTCLVCSHKIVTARMGRGLRPTYWCPHCQGELHDSVVHARGLAPAVVDAFVPAC